MTPAQLREAIAKAILGYLRRPMNPDDLNDISPDGQPSTRHERRIIASVERSARSGQAIHRFVQDSPKLGDFWYWELLGRIWCSNSEHTHLDLWRGMFASDRPKRASSLMHPSELRVFNALRPELIVLRAHSLIETDWMSYTISTEAAARWARQLGLGQVASYKLSLADCLGIFTRRNAWEVIAPDRDKAVFVRMVPVVVREDAKA